MPQAESAEFERELLYGPLGAALGITHGMPAKFEAGLVDDLVRTRGVKLWSRMTNRLSSKWIRDRAGKVAAGESVTLPSADSLETVASHNCQAS